MKFSRMSGLMAVLGCLIKCLGLVHGFDGSLENLNMYPLLKELPKFAKRDQLPD